MGFSCGPGPACRAHGRALHQWQVLWPPRAVLDPVFLQPCCAIALEVAGGAGAFIGFSKLQLFPGYFKSICAMLCGTETGCESVVNHLHTRKKYRYGRQCLHGSAVCLLQKCFLFSNITGIQDIR